MTKEMKSRQRKTENVKYLSLNSKSLFSSLSIVNFLHMNRHSSGFHDEEASNDVQLPSFVCNSGLNRYIKKTNYFFPLNWLFSLFPKDLGRNPFLFSKERAISINNKIRLLFFFAFLSQYMAMVLESRGEKNQNSPIRKIQSRKNERDNVPM